MERSAEAMSTATLLQTGAVHLARDRPLPYQVVEPAFVRPERAGDRRRVAGDVGGADRLVRLLRVAGPGPEAVRALGHVARPVLRLDVPAHRPPRLVGEVDAVGPHVGDEADGLAAQIDAFVEPLRRAHGPRCAESQLARGFLLQCRGREGRLRVAPDLLLLDLRDAVCVAFDLRDRGGRRFLVADFQAVELGAVQMGQTRGDRGSPGGAEIGLDGPVFPRPEDFDLRLALADQAERDRLDPPGGTRAGQLVPEHRRQREADEVVQRAARQIGVDQSLVEFARVAQRLVDGGLGDLVGTPPA